jgi:hypothetical protein
LMQRLTVLLSFVVVVVSHFLERNSGLVHQIGFQTFLYPFQFVIHQLSYHLMLHKLSH